MGWVSHMEDDFERSEQDLILHRETSEPAPQSDESNLVPSSSTDATNTFLLFLARDFIANVVGDPVVALEGYLRQKGITIEDNRGKPGEFWVRADESYRGFFLCVHLLLGLSFSFVPVRKRRSKGPGWRLLRS